MQIITLANKKDMLCDFHIKQKLCALEWKINGMINKNKSLFNKFDGNWRHPLNRSFQKYCV